MAEVREGDSNWLHHLSGTIRDGHELDHQCREEGNQRTKNSVRYTPPIQQGVHG
ncbi:hypothetical protein DPMN_065565 [Dreissena polymorpha]|uniref:Uncharacterized protein n=1 Tax=Dreissena polymorpha TaxID=45954 RepID=A0A9D3YXF9_DREPO|nr:hypothetical protein DPMN_065565 [Dreissena polymorpha]